MSQRDARKVQVTGALPFVSADFKDACRAVLHDAAKADLLLDKAHFGLPTFCRAEFSVVPGSQVDAVAVAARCQRLAERRGLSAKTQLLARTSSLLVVELTPLHSAWPRWLGLACLLTGLFLTWRL